MQCQNCQELIILSFDVDKTRKSCDARAPGTVVEYGMGEMEIHLPYCPMKGIAIDPLVERQCDCFGERFPEAKSG